MPENKILEAPPRQLLKISQLVSQGRVDLDDLAQILPGILHVNSREDLSIVYISPKGQELLRYSLCEFRVLGFGLMKKHQSDYTLNITYPRLFQELAKENRGQVIPYFQDWQHEPADKPFYLFTSTRILNKEQLISISLFPNQIEYLCAKVDHVFGINKTLEDYYGAYMSLTNREKQILDLLGKELARKEISELLFIDEKTVKKHCENIFRKLGTNKRTTIREIALAFDSL